MEIITRIIANILTTLYQPVGGKLLLSFTIEMFQLFLRLETWQLSDLFYNALSDAVGGPI